MAVSAHVITMGLENDINGNIKAWFKQFNFLPPIPLAAAQVDTISHDLFRASVGIGDSVDIHQLHSHHSRPARWLWAIPSAFPQFEQERHLPL
jgi:hypothetical protein